MQRHAITQPATKTASRALAKQVEPPAVSADVSTDSQTRTGRSPIITIPLLERAALTPNEFAAVMGRQTTWGYRAIYSGRVKIIRGMGRIMIPQSEVKRLLADLETYTGNKKKPAEPQAAAA